MREIAGHDGWRNAAPQSREREMQYLGFALFVVAAAAGAWFLGRAMTSAGRNQGSTYGGGIDEETAGASDYHFLSGTADGGDA
jgi:hypothetical protein